MSRFSYFEKELIIDRQFCPIYGDVKPVFYDLKVLRKAANFGFVEKFSAAEVFLQFFV